MKMFVELVGAGFLSVKMFVELVGALDLCRRKCLKTVSTDF